MAVTSPIPVLKKYTSETDRVKVYKHRLELAERKFQQKEPKAKEMVSRYKNKLKVEQVTPAGHRVAVPTGTAIIDALFSSMTAVEVEVVVDNCGHGTNEEARIAEAGIRDVWREQKVERKGERTIKDALVVGLGWAKVDYEYQEDTIKRTRDRNAVLKDVDLLYAHAEATGMAPPSPETVRDLVPLEETVREVVRDRIVVDHCPWASIRWDATAERAEDVRWVAQMTQLPVYEVKENPVYKEFVKAHRDGPRKLRDLNADSSVRVEIDMTMDLPEPTHHEDDDRITVIEFWDLEDGTVSVFAKEGDFLLHQRPNPLFLNEDLADKSPFVPLVLRFDMDEVWGLSDMELMLPALDELVEYRSNLATYIARTIPKLIGPDGAITDSGKEALQNRTWGAYVGLEAGVPASEIQPLTPPALPQEVFNIPEKLENAIREATGVNELMRGIFPDRRRTATETAEVVAASSARQSEKRNLLERFYVDIARRVLQLMQMMYDHERVTRLVEDTGDVVWEYTAEDIAAEARLRVFLSPKEARTDQTRRDQALAVTNLLSNPMALNFVDGVELYRWLLRRMGLDDGEIRDILKLPEEQQEDQMKQMAMQAQGVGMEAAASAMGQQMGPQGAAGIAGAAPMTGNMAAAYLEEPEEGELTQQL